MLSDFTLIQHKFPENNDIIIRPVFDLHTGARQHLAKEWNAFLAYLKDHPNVYLILGGDLSDNATKDGIGDIFDATMRPRDQKDKLISDLKPFKNRILCGTDGNHERRSSKNNDNCITYDIMQCLDIADRYRENCPVVKIQIGKPKGNGKKNPTYIIGVTHGCGGGKKTGSAVNRDEDFAYNFEGVDCVVVGHDHKPFATAPSKLKVDPFNNKITQRPLYVIGASSWLSFGGYALRGMMRPASHIAQQIILSGNKKGMMTTLAWECD